MPPDPHDIALAGVYLPPLLVAATIGAMAAWATAKALNRTRLSRFLLYPPAIFVALFVLYTGVIGSTLIPV